MATTSSVAASSSAGTIDVPTIVSQLMAVERQPINTLNTHVSSYQTKISSFGTISGLVSGFQSALQSLTTGLQAFSATSSDTSAFSASAITTAVAGTYALNVSKLAQSQNMVATGQTSSTIAIGTGTPTTINFGAGKSVVINGTNNTLQGIRDAINAANIGISAAIVNDGSATPNRLTLTSTATGVSNGFTITATPGGDATVSNLLTTMTQTVAAQDAAFTVNGIAITSASNTVTNAIQGVTLTLKNLTTAPATLTVARDTAAISTALSGVVDAYNAMSNQLTSRSAYGNATTPAGALAGDGTLRLMQDQLRSIFTTAATGGTLTSLAQVGVTFQAGGTLKLDSTQLSSAMSNNFSDVTNLFSSASGYATRLQAWTQSVLASGTGLIANRTDSLNSTIQRYNDQISRLENRMTQLQKQYTTTYTNLNMALSSMNATSAYLTKQLG